MGDFISKVTYGLSAIRERGIVFLFTYFYQSVWFDIRHGTSTSARVTKEAQSIGVIGDEEENGLLYVSSFTNVIRETLQKARSHIGEEALRNAQFFDLGCGKGKALLVYKKYEGSGSVHSAVGIEYDTSLVPVAESNVLKMGFGPDDIRIINGSATNIIDYVTADFLLVYIYNSFQGKTFEDVIDAISHLPHILIYIDPAEKHILQTKGYNIFAENQGKLNADTWLVAASKV